MYFLVTLYVSIVIGVSISGFNNIVNNIELEINHKWYNTLLENTWIMDDYDFYVNENIKNLKNNVTIDDLYNDGWKLRYNKLCFYNGDFISSDFPNFIIEIDKVYNNKINFIVDFGKILSKSNFV